MIRVSMSKAPRPKLKAAEGRRFLVALRHMLVHFFPRDNVYEQTRFSCIDALHECYQELDRWDDSLSPGRLAKHGRSFVLLGRLTGEDREATGIRWRLYPKLHLFGHLVSESTSNPKDSWNYTMESEIGCATELAARCNRLHVHRQLLKRQQLAL